MQTKRQQELAEMFSLIGLTLATLHEVEASFAQAHLIGMSEDQKRRHSTMNDLLAARERMTFGQLVSVFKQQWSLRPEVEAFLDHFVRERNTFVHQLTTLPGYNPRYKKERLRLNARVKEFYELAVFARRLFAAAKLTSDDFAAWWLKEHKGLEFKLPQTEYMLEEIEFFKEVLRGNDQAKAL